MYLINYGLTTLSKTDILHRSQNGKIDDSAGQRGLIYSIEGCFVPVFCSMFQYPGCFNFILGFFSFNFQLFFFYGPKCCPLLFFCSFSSYPLKKVISALEWLLTTRLTTSTPQRCARAFACVCVRAPKNILSIPCALLVHHQAVTIVDWSILTVSPGN